MRERHRTKDGRAGETDQSKVHGGRNTAIARCHRSQYEQSPCTEAELPSQCDDRFHEEVNGVATIQSLGNAMPSRRAAAGRGSGRENE